MDINHEDKKYEDDFLNFSIRATSTEVIIWNIYDYFNRRKTADRFDSPLFSFQQADWCIRVYPKTRSREGDVDYTGFMIVRSHTHVPYHKLNVILKENLNSVEESFVLAFDGEHREDDDIKTIPLARGWRFKQSLTLICQISVCKSVVDAFAQTESSIQDTKDTATGTLCQNFKNLLLNGQDHDVVLKVKDKEFRAHQNILRARSPVFDSMLNHDMIEKNSGVIDIPECDPGAFEQFLLYLYCAKVERLDKDNMLPLYYVADKYDMDHLKEDCREFIKKSLSTSNITDVVEIALNHSDADLLRCGTEYFVKTVNEVLPTVEWQSFMKRNTTQANELLIKAVKKLSDGRT